MSLFRWLLLVFLLVPLGEIYVLIKVGSIVGALPTVALVVFTAVLGAALMRAQGFSTLARVQASLDRGELPATELVEGALILLAGALLLTPGFITDTVGFVCLVPPWRRGPPRGGGAPRGLLARGVGRFQVHLHGRPDQSPGARDRGRVIEGEYRRNKD
jgi:UPF0716 protein FxsA